MIDLNEFVEKGDVAPLGESCLLRVELDGIEPSIDRLLIVPRMANLSWVHAVIQVAMGWTNSHLHQFRIGDVRISDPRFNLDEYEGDPPVVDEAKVTLEEVLAGKGLEFIYEYDFGDSWNHVLTFLKTGPSQEAGIKHRAVCLKGHRACPPEDCGSIPGYENLLAALRDRKHPEHRSMRQWLGRPYDPEAFSVEKANRFLAQLKWPKVTEAALRKVLMARDRAKP